MYSCISNKILKQIVSTYGYYQVNLHNGYGQITYKVHRLELIVFVPNPYNKPQVNHIDTNRLNNVLTNLEWTTAQENTDHKVCNNLNLL